MLPLGAFADQPHRQEIKRAPRAVHASSTPYNASAESMAAGLDLLCSLSARGSRMAILGEMGEMGDDVLAWRARGRHAAAKKLTCWRAWVVSWSSHGRCRAHDGGDEPHPGVSPIIAASTAWARLKT